MGEKTEQKRTHILHCARAVFAQKGFCNVTMKDIVEACEISRGGLYRYFGSTEEIFLEVLKEETEKQGEENAEQLPEDATMADLLLLFLKEQKREILRKKKEITIAAYEYFFFNKPEKKSDNLLRTRFEESVLVLGKILEEGTRRGEFYCDDTAAAAAHIMYTLEGMKICVRTMGMSENRIDREILHIVEGLIVEE